MQKKTERGERVLNWPFTDRRWLSTFLDLRAFEAWCAGYSYVLSPGSFKELIKDFAWVTQQTLSDVEGSLCTDYKVVIGRSKSGHLTFQIFKNRFMRDEQGWHTTDGDHYYPPHLNRPQT